MSQKIPFTIADFEVQLASSISIGAVSFDISSQVDDDGNNIPDGVYAFTVDGSSAAKEYLVGVKTGTAIASVVSISRQGVQATGAQREHRLGASCKITDYAVLQRIGDTLRGTVQLDGAAPLSYDAVPTLSNGAQLATVQYVLDIVSGGSASFDNITFTNQTAGETIAQGNAVYLKFSDMRWYKAEADVDATISNTVKGIAKGAGSTGNIITGGVQSFGFCNVFTGLTANTDYFLSDTAGAISTTPGTKRVYIGKSSNTTTILVNINLAVAYPTEYVSTSAGVADAFKGTVLGADGKLSSTVVSSELMSAFGDGSDGNVVLDGTNTFSFLTKVGSVYTMQRDTYFNNLTVNAGSELVSDGWLVSINGTLSGAGTINFGVPSAGGNGTNAVNGPGAVASGSGRFKTTPGGQGGSNSDGSQGTAGQLGGASGKGGDWVNNGGAVLAANASQYVKIGSMAYNTLNGFDLASGATFNFKAYLGGSGGGGGGSNSTADRGGGGGSGGAPLVILVRNWTGTVVLKSIGGNGGNGWSSAGGGGGGGGGTIIVVYLTKTWTGTYIMTGGTPGTGGSGATSGSVGVSREYQVALLTR